MVDFVLDDKGDWIARLSCGHGQHVRHRLPFQDRAWVLDPATRQERLGRYLMCPLCDRAELPDGLHLLRESPMWDNESAPSAIRNSHHLAEGTWAVITVEAGQMRFLADGEVVMNKVVDANSRQAIPPGLDHRVEFEGPVRFSIDFLSFEGEPFKDSLNESVMSRRTQDDSIDVASNEGGESACFAHLVCTVCGAVIESEPHTHRLSSA